MMRIVNTVLLILVAAVAVGLYDIKYRSEAAERDVAALHRDIAQEEETLRVLRAEWSHLNTPALLQGYADRLLTDLQPLQPAQIGTFDDVPTKARPDDLYRYGRQPLGGYAGTPMGGIY